MKDFFKALGPVFGGLLYFFFPVICVFVGAGLIGLGISMGWDWLAWAGLVLGGLGVIWILAYLSHHLF